MISRAEAVEFKFAGSQISGEIAWLEGSQKLAFFIVLLGVLVPLFVRRRRGS